MTTASTIIDRILSADPLPNIYSTIEKLTDDETASIGDIAESIDRDPILTQSVMQLANSNLFGYSEKINSIPHAFGVLDQTQLHDLVLAASSLQLFTQFPNYLMDIDIFKHRSIHCGLVTRLLISLFNPRDSERFFVAGLLHEIGHLILFSELPEKSLEIVTHSKEWNQPVHLVEREFLGFDYADVGAELLSELQVPACFREPTLHHIEPAEADHFTMESAAVHIASHMMDNEDFNEDWTSPIPTIEPSAWKITGLTTDIVFPISRFAKYLGPPQPLFDSFASALAPFKQELKDSESESRPH